MSTSPARWPAYARVPPFLPVPVRARADGWTLERQGRFVGYLAETGSVAEAARRVGMSRVAAYQLKKRAGAESFAHAWDRVLALRAAAAGERAAVPRRNFTPDERAEAGMEGVITVLMRRGRFVRAERRICVISLIRHANRLDSAARRYGWDWCAAMDPEAASDAVSDCTFPGVSCQPRRPSASGAPDRPNGAGSALFVGPFGPFRAKAFAPRANDLVGVRG